MHETAKCYDQLIQELYEQRARATKAYVKGLRDGIERGKCASGWRLCLAFLLGICAGSIIYFLG